MNSKSDQFSKTQTQQRMIAALRGARVSGHKSMSDIPKQDGSHRGKNVKQKRKRKT